MVNRNVGKQDVPCQLHHIISHSCIASSIDNELTLMLYKFVYVKYLHCCLLLET